MSANVGVLCAVEYTEYVVFSMSPAYAFRPLAASAIVRSSEHLLSRVDSHTKNEHTVQPVVFTPVCTRTLVGVAR